MSEWGVPDWRDASAYPDPKQTLGLEWWWEFTRRRPDYRALWTAVAVDRTEGGWSLDTESGRRTFYPADRHGLILRFQLNALLDPTCSHSYLEISSRRWSLNHSLPSATTISHRAVNEAKLLGDQIGAEGVEALLEEQKAQADAASTAGVTLYQFDLSKPLAPQLDRARADLEFWQGREFGKKNTRKARRGNWREFLRAIDAREGGATYREIRDVFWTGRSQRKDGKEEKTEQSARDTYAAACELRDNFPI
jgi:hypothetical protein